MDGERFKILAEAYGADLSRWPGAEREAAARFVGGNGQAQSWLDEAAALDALLDRSPTAPVSAILRETIIGLAPKVYRPVWKRRTAWATGVGLAAACVLGLYVGANLPSSYLGDPTATPVQTAFDGGTYLDALESEG